MAVATCPHCSSPYTVGSNFVPHKYRCPKCKTLMGTPPEEDEDDGQEKPRPRRPFPPVHWMLAVAGAFVAVVLNSGNGDSPMALAAGGAQIGGWSAFAYLVARAIDRVYLDR